MSIAKKRIYLNMITKNILLLIGALTILCAGVVGVNAYLSKKAASVIENHEEELLEESTSTESEVISSTSEIDTSDWRTFKNEVYAYEIKYPSDWKCEYDSSFVRVSIESPDLEYDEEILESGTSIMINILTPEYDPILKREPEIAKDPKNWLDRMWEACSEGACAPQPPVFKEKINVADQKAIKAELGTIPGLENHIYIGKDKNIFDLSILFPKTDKEKYEKIFNQMLSTFRFIDS